MSSKRPLKIIFDVDGCLADFTFGFTFRAREMGFNCDVIRTPKHQAWDVFPGLTKDQVDAVWRTMDDPTDSFWLGLEPLVFPETAARIARLARTDGVEVYFVSHRRTPSALRQTRDWLRMKLGLSPNVMLSSKKGLVAQGIDADFFIDDKAGNSVFVQYNSPGTRSYILDRPYNQFPDTIGTKVTRVATVDAFLDDVEVECGKRGISV